MDLDAGDSKEALADGLALLTFEMTKRRETRSRKRVGLNENMMDDLIYSWSFCFELN